MHRSGSSWSALHTSTLTQSVVDTLRDISADPATDIGALYELIRRQLPYDDGQLRRCAKEGLMFLQHEVRIHGHNEWFLAFRYDQFRHRDGYDRLQLADRN